MKPPRSRSERERLRVPSRTVARSSVPDHQGLTQGVRLQLELVDPVLDDVPDAHDPGEPAVLDDGEVTDAMAGHQRHDGGDPVARRAREHPCRHHPRYGEGEHMRVVLDQGAHHVAFRDDAEDASAVFAHHHERPDVPALELPGHRVERRVRAGGFHMATFCLEDRGNGHERSPPFWLRRPPLPGDVPTSLEPSSATSIPPSMTTISPITSAGWPRRLHALGGAWAAPAALGLA